MVKQTTDTSVRPLVPEGHYKEAIVRKCLRKDIKPVGKNPFTIYEWTFDCLVDNDMFTFTINLFSSQMSELLRASGAKETSPNKFDWDDDEVVGMTFNFNLVHKADNKGVLREQLADIVPVATAKTVKTQWEEEDGK